MNASTPVTSDNSIATALRKSIDHAVSTPSCYMCSEATCTEEGTALDLIMPCPCETYVHRQCLDQWRVTSNTQNAMTHCPTCQAAYETDDVLDESALEREILWAQVWRAAIVVLVVLAGSLTIYLIDAGTPRFFKLHWNAMDGQIYNWIGLTSLPRFVVYTLLSFGMTALVAGCIALVRWCRQTSLEPAATSVCCVEFWSDCDGFTEHAWVVVVIMIVCAIFAGLVMLVTAVVGGIGSAVDERQGHRIRRLKVQKSRVRNFRPLPQV